MIQNECQANKAASQASTLELRRLTALASAPLARKRRQVEVENAREILQTGDTTYVSPAEVADEVSASVDAPEVQHGSLSSSATRRRVAALVPEIPQPSPSSSLQAELSKGESKAVQEGEAQRRRNQQGTETSEGADGKQISPEAFAQEPETSKDATPELQPSSDRSGPTTAKEESRGTIQGRGPCGKTATSASRKWGVGSLGKVPGASLVFCYRCGHGLGLRGKPSTPLAPHRAVRRSRP